MIKKTVKRTCGKRLRGKPAKPFTAREIKKQIRKGNLTKEQINELRQKYMDSLEYDTVCGGITDCGGIQPVVLPPDKK